MADGDTITVLTSDLQQIRVRLYGIDAPEKKQPFGQASRKTLADMVAGKEVDVDPVSIDRYGRTVGVVTLDGININESMLAAGMAWVYPKFCKKRFCRRWQEVEREAREARRGLWKEKAVAPWEWRKWKKKN